MTVAVKNIAIPKAADIDYSDAEEIYGYQLLLCKMFEKAGGSTCPAVTNATTRRGCSEGHIIWL